METKDCQCVASDAWRCARQQRVPSSATVIACRCACHRVTRRLTRNERLQEAADAGHDTWEDYRGER